MQGTYNSLYNNGKGLLQEISVQLILNETFNSNFFFFLKHKENKTSWKYYM